jgi:hypothetical protein
MNSRRLIFGLDKCRSRLAYYNLLKYGGIAAACSPGKLAGEKYQVAELKRSGRRQ